MPSETITRGVLNPLLAIWRELPAFGQLTSALDGAQTPTCRGVPPAARAPLAAALVERLQRPVLWITPSLLAAEQLCQDVALYWEGGGPPATPRGPEEAFLFPEKEAHGVDPLRLELLQRVDRGEARLAVAPLRAVLQKTITAEALSKGRVELTVGQSTDLHTLLELLVEEGYTRVPMVERRGEVSLRGGILDIYPATDEPVRIELFGDEIESMRRFDKDTQRSVVDVHKVTLLPAREVGGSYLLEHFPRGSVVVLEEVSQLRLNAMEVSHESTAGLQEEGWAGEWGDFLALLTPFRMVQLTSWEDTTATLSEEVRVDFPAAVQPVFPTRVEGLFKTLPEWQAQGKRTVILTRQHRRMLELVKEHQLSHVVTELPIQPGQVALLNSPGNLGYRLESLEVLTDHEIMGTPITRKPPPRKADRSSLLRLGELDEGQLVVHLQHGIGRYLGVRQLDVVGQKRDFLQLEYAKGDTLYVPVEQLDLIQKYQGIEERVPSLSRMGGQEWRSTRAKVKEAAEKIARELLELYARRELSQGHSYPPDTAWQAEMEEAFPHTETADQLRVIHEVKGDMERPRPMDRLVCGDVGYGKTEVALRAAFKAVMDGKQVAVLVPTTVLAHQHYQTFSTRLAPFPARVEMLSRFRSPAETRDVLKSLKSGDVDIVIGTHRLLSQDVEYNKLGLLIIDEEHRFGVKQKERLKEIRHAVDVLTLTATPIPRTLHMSMVGIRDMSIIETPPEDRLPIKTYLFESHPEILRGAITRELQRGGQVYLVHNRVHGIERLAQDIRRLVPQARIAVGHGQMEEGALEKVMMEFLEGTYDVLVCTTIIESGIDIPNVNTIVINNAHAFGLSQLYQLRGRVGRSTRQAYCYLLLPAQRALTPEAEKRLETIRDFTHLGAGFQIALRDLEIRGAGDLLGAEQSGQIAAVGFDLYCRMLGDAVKLLRGEKADYQEEFTTVLELPIPASLPDDYVADSRQKVALYKRIANLRSEGERQELEAELRDRFGPLPDPTRYLLEVVELKLRARDLEIPSIRVKEGKMTLLMPFYRDITIKECLKLYELTGWRCAHQQKALVFAGLQGRGAGPPIYPPPGELLGKLRDILDRLKRWQETPSGNNPVTKR